MVSFAADQQDDGSKAYRDAKVATFIPTQADFARLARQEQVTRSSVSSGSDSSSSDSDSFFSSSDSESETVTIDEQTVNMAGEQKQSPASVIEESFEH